MSVVLAALFLLFSACSTSASLFLEAEQEPEAQPLPALKTGTVQRSLQHDGMQRSYILFVPEFAQVGDPLPLLLNFHGFTGTAESQMNYADFRSLAEEHGFILVYPQGTLLNGQDTHWNVGGWTRGSETDDVSFVEFLIEVLDSEYPIDRERIYATGHSNGGYMSILLVCQPGSEFAAVASMAGSMTPEMMRDCDPDRPVPVMQIHGTADSVVPYGGTSWSESIDETLGFWIEHNGTEQEPEIRSVPPSEYSSARSSVEIHTYGNGDHESIVEHIKVIDGGHEWLGQANDTGQVNLDLMTNDVIWEFLSKYDLNGER